ncbi:MAG: hypothetical protein NVS9B10_02570 [Nevskia sp.]
MPFPVPVTEGIQLNDEAVTQMSRRTMLKLGLASLATGVSGVAAAQAQKISQASVMYVDASKNGMLCEQCIQFIAPGACKIVEGKINPKGYCVAFAPKPK